MVSSGKYDDGHDSETILFWRVHVIQQPSHPYEILLVEVISDCQLWLVLRGSVESKFLGFLWASTDHALGVESA